MAGRKAKDAGQQVSTAQRLGGLVKACRAIMRKDKGLNGDLDRLPQLTWILFLKFLDDLERQDETLASLAKKPYRPLIPPPYRWRDWAAPADGITGDELVAFVNNDEAVLPTGGDEKDPVRGAGLFAKLRGLQGDAGGDRRDVVARVFQGTSNRMLNGYLLRDVLTKVNGIHFTSSDEVHTLSKLYEGMLREMRDAAGDSGEFYTPRPVVQLIVRLTNPRLGETVLDPACGTCGFLVEAYEHLKGQVRTKEERARLQRETLFGGEAKSLPYLLGEMNLLLHGVEVPNVAFGNGLAVKLSDIGDEDRVDVIMTNPPFAGEEEPGIKANFPADMQTAETALLFLQLVMRRLRRPGHLDRPGGRAAFIVPNGVLYGDGVCARIKGHLLKNFNLHTVVRLPDGVFEPYTPIPTNILFFDRGGPTADIWFYEQPAPEGRKKYSKTLPIRVGEFEPMLAWWNDRQENERAWKVRAADVLKHDGNAVVACNLGIANPRATRDADVASPADLISGILEAESRILGLMAEVKDLLLGQP